MASLLFDIGFSWGAEKGGHKLTVCAEEWPLERFPREANGYQDRITTW